MSGMLNATNKSCPCRMSQDAGQMGVAWETRFQLDVRQQDWAEGWLDGRRWGGGGGAAVAAMERAAE
jgi:hypothetical protein